MIYIEEAHPTDGWEMPSNLKEGILIATARTFAERDEDARVCVVKLGIKIPALVDDMQDTTERAYTGWPDRLYVIARDGRVAYKSPAGPFGFHPEAMAKALPAAASSGH